MPSNESDILPDPPDELKAHSARLTELIRQRIAAQGPIAFSEFMEMALYEPGLGYYSAGLHKFGAEGDFVTAPELGDVFADCLAWQLCEIAEQLGPCEVLEIGAGSGRLAARLLSKDSPASLAERINGYRILERSADLRSVQQDRISSMSLDAASKTHWINEPPGEQWKGIVVANEVVDALVVERFRIKDGQTLQVCVDTDGNSLSFVDREAPAELKKAVAGLGPLPDGYCSEINIQLGPWLHEIMGTLERGIGLFFDYGYPRREFYRVERRDGTAMAHYRHRAHTDLLRFPGLQDLTAWVDFTALAHAAHSCGLDVPGYTSQAMFLMGCGLDEVVRHLSGDDQAENLALNSEVKQLTHPSMMGERFQVMALGRNWPEERPLRGFALSDLRHRL